MSATHHATMHVSGDRARTVRLSVGQGPHGYVHLHCGETRTTFALAPTGALDMAREMALPV